MGAASGVSRPYYDSSYSNELVPPSRQQQQLMKEDGFSSLSPLPVDSVSSNGPESKYHVPYPADPTLLRIPYITRYPFQDYRFAKKVANGRFGSVVYKATKLHGYVKTNERVAIKEILTQDLKAVDYEDLRYEINILSQLTHENIVQYREVYEPESTQNAKMYIVIEYLHGGELLSALINEGSYTFYDILFYFQQILSAIDYLRRHGVVHGNIIPENIIVQEKYNGKSRKENVIKLVGFDHAECFSSSNASNPSSSATSSNMKRPVRKIAKDQKFCPPEYRDEDDKDHIDGEGHTHRKSILDTAPLPHFIAQKLGGTKLHQYDNKTLENHRPAVDVWGFGCMMYFLLTGSLPYVEVLHYWEKPKRKLSFKEKVWEFFDDSARDFFDGVLNCDPTQRMKTNEIKKHPWFMRNVVNLIDNDVDLRSNINDLRFFQIERSRFYSMIIASKPVNFKHAARFQDDQVSPTFVQVNC